MQNLSSSIKLINPSSIINEGFELDDKNIIPHNIINGDFSPFNDYIEFFLYDSNKNLIESNYNFKEYSILDPNPNTSASINQIQLYPDKDIYDLGYNNGKYYSIYNFIKYELGSSRDKKFFIKEISSDRTEIKISSNYINNNDLINYYTDLKNKIDNSEYFDEFYVTFDENQYNIGINILYDNGDILIKLYQPLPPNFTEKNTLYITSKTSETLSYEIIFPEINYLTQRKKYILGPNININVKDSINNSTEYKNYDELVSSSLSGSRDQLNNLINTKGVFLTPNYSYDTFDEFVNFSSAKKRIENFIYKVGQIESYNNDISSISSITGSTSSSYQISSSINILENYISDIIKHFDGYEYYLYFDSGSSSYPKSNSQYPYTLYSTGSSQVLTWKGSDEVSNQYYGGIILSASLYDDDNQNNLKYSIPEFIKINQDNDSYIDFINMIGQHFDEIWLYIKNITQISNTTNELDKGIPLQLVNEAIKSLGFEEISNNYNNINNYSSLIGLSPDGTYGLPTGSELITDNISINLGNLSSSWNPSYEFLDAFSYATDDINKELYKRLYHNMSYLVKKKGTISGLKQLINIWGIPNTILRINEFGGKDKNEETYDSWNNRYSYAFNTRANSIIRVPWTPLVINYLKNESGSKVIVPDSIQFRFKTTGLPSSSEGIRYTQSLLLKKSNDSTDNYFDFGIYLYYTGSYDSGSYSGSIQDPYKDYGTIKFYISASSEHGGSKSSDPIYLPFFNKEWWSVMLQRDNHVSASNNEEQTTYTLYVKNNIYSGYDGNKIGYQGSSSINTSSTSSMYGSASYGTGSYGPLSSINRAWNSVHTSSLTVSYRPNINGLFFGGNVSGSIIGNVSLSLSNSLFSGSIQEIRLYGNVLSESVFNDYVMNPRSIKGLTDTGSNSSFDILSFRAPLGNELESKYITLSSSYHTQSFTSSHPSYLNIESKYHTSSFIYKLFGFDLGVRESSSVYHIAYNSSSYTGAYSEPVTDYYYSNQVVSGIRDNVDNKIKVVTSSSYGTILTKDVSIQQNYEIDNNYTEDLTSLEVSFSPQDNINEDIIQSLNYDAVLDVLGDLREISSSEDYYPSLRKKSEYYFQKYNNSDIYNFIRLIKYIDNSLFKAIKNYVPARTNLSTGIVIKQHLLERNKLKPTQISYLRNNYSTSIEIGDISAGTGGSLDKYNYSGSASFDQIDITQSWVNSFDTPQGTQTIIENTQKEFYNGEFSGSNILATTQSLNPGNTYLHFSSSQYTTSFANSYYNAFHNNVTGSRLNSFYQNVDYSYDYKTPVNIDSIRSGSASLFSVPDSNYTTTRIIRPRYEGSRLKGLQYNKFSSYGTVEPNISLSLGLLERLNPAEYFLNGDTGSWEGDTSYGKNPVIERRPLYFAHFKNSYENYNMWGTYTYTIDQLIEIPDKDVSNNKDFSPKIISLEDNKNNVIDVSSTFNKDNYIDIIYNSDIYDGINYTNFKIKPKKIYQGALSYQTLCTNQSDYSTIALSQSFTRFQTIYTGSSSNGTVQLGTGSNRLILSGSLLDAPVFFFNSVNKTYGVGLCSLKGPRLAVYHTYNQYLYNREIETTSLIPPKARLFVDAKLDPTDLRNYFVFNSSASLAPNYEEPSIPFLILPGDEIRVNYSSSIDTSDSEYEQVFTVLGYGTPQGDTWPHDSGSSNNHFTIQTNGVGYNIGTRSLDPQYETIRVYPDPETLYAPIPKGEIYKFTIRRRIETSNKLLILSPPPSGSQGVRTMSGGGFIIPQSVSKTQKDNIYYIINQLKQKNSFRNDDNV